MTIIAIVISALLEQHKWIYKCRAWFTSILKKYTNIFTKSEPQSQRSIRMVYLLACIIPFFILTLSGSISLIIGLYPIYMLLTMIIFMLSVDVLGWKEEAKNTSPNGEYLSFVQTYATKFFATVFWFMVLPYGVGALCYLIILLITQTLKAQVKDSLIYDEIIDKMMFYANIAPYTLLFLFIAAAGDFEEVTHHLVEQYKKITKSYYFLKTTLNEVVLIAIGKNKFIQSNHPENDNTTDVDYSLELTRKNIVNPKINEYIVALLYRSGLMFLILVAIMSLSSLLR